MIKNKQSKISTKKTPAKQETIESLTQAMKGLKARVTKYNNEQVDKNKHFEVALDFYSDGFLRKQEIFESKIEKRIQYLENSVNGFLNRVGKLEQFRAWQVLAHEKGEKINPSFSIPESVEKEYGTIAEIIEKIAEEPTEGKEDSE